MRSKSILEYDSTGVNLSHISTQVTRTHHIPRVKLRPWVSLVGLQEVEEGGGSCRNHSLTSLKGGRDCGKLAARSTGSFSGEEAEMKQDTTSSKSLSKIG